MCLEDTIKVVLDCDEVFPYMKVGDSVAGYVLVYNGEKTLPQFNLSLSFEDKTMQKIKR